MAKLFGLGKPIFVAVAESFCVNLLSKKMQCRIIITDGFHTYKLQEIPLHRWLLQRPHTFFGVMTTRLSAVR